MLLGDTVLLSILGMLLCLFSLFFFVKNPCLSLSFFFPSIHLFIFYLPLLPYCTALCFLRGEVVAKADHTDQILYSEIGKLNIMHVYGSLTTQITLETEFQN